VVAGPSARFAALAVKDHFWWRKLMNLSSRTPALGQRCSLRPTKRNSYTTRASPEPAQVVGTGQHCCSSANSGLPSRTFGTRVLPSLCPMRSGHCFSGTGTFFTTYPHLVPRSYSNGLRSHSAIRSIVRRFVAKDPQILDTISCTV